MTSVLHELLEEAVRHAPDERHSVAEIVTAAQGRHRRRTTGVIAGSVAAALVVGGLGYAGVSRLTRDDAGPVDPAGKVVQLSDARLAVPGEDYELLSSHTSGTDREILEGSPDIRYVTPTDDGREVVVLERSSEEQRFGVLEPGSGAIEWLTPPAGARTASPYEIEDSRQMWGEAAAISSGMDETVHILEVGTGWTSVTLGEDSIRDFWLLGDRVWFSAVDGRAPSGAPVELYSVPIDGSEEPRREVDAALSVVGAERGNDARYVAWLTYPLDDSPELVVRDVESGDDIEVPFDVPAGSDLSPHSLLVAGDRVGFWSLSEREGTVIGRLTVASFDGEPLVSIDGAYQARMSDEAVWIQSTEEAVGTYVYPFESGELLRLSRAPSSTLHGTIRGDHLTWSTEESGRSTSYFARLL